MNFEIEQVNRFYSLIWNQHDMAVIPQILSKNLRFKGSLGVDALDYSGFIRYVDSVHAALQDYQCSIVDLVAAPPKVVARMKFSGIHANQFMGFAPTDRQISWEGAAFFTFQDRLISDIWVIADRKSIEEQLVG